MEATRALPCPGECESRTLGAAALPGGLPCSRALTGPLPVLGPADVPRPSCSSAPGPQAQRSPALICLEFSNKETCGREEGGREGYRGGRPSGRMIPPPSPVTRGQAGGRRRRKKRRRGRGSGCAGARGVRRGLPGLTQAAHLLPGSWGRGRDNPGSREGSKGNPAPTLAPSLPSHQLLLWSQQTLSPRPGKIPRSQFLLPLS